MLRVLSLLSLAFTCAEASAAPAVCEDEHCHPTHGPEGDDVGLMQWSTYRAAAAQEQDELDNPSGDRIKRRAGEWFHHRRRPYTIKNRRKGTNYHSQALGGGRCGIYAGDARFASVHGPDQAFFWATDEGNGMGTVGGKCDVSLIESWAKWGLEPCESPAAWAYVWQGPTSVTEEGKNFVGARGKVKVPSKPTAKGVDHTYFLFLLGMQPALQPNLTNVTQFCDLEGDPSSIVYNSGHFARVIYRSNASTMFGFDDSLFNLGKDWDGNYLMASNFLLGKSSLGPTWGYGSVVQTGEWVSLDATNNAGNLVEEGVEMSWVHHLRVEKTRAQVSFAFNSSVFENVFLYPAIEQGLIEAGSPEAQVVEDQNWTWSVGPVYEWTVVAAAPPLDQIPLMWPKEPIEWRDFEFDIQDNGTFRNHTKKDGTVEPWVMLFGEGLEVTGSAFGGRLFVDYDKLDAYFVELAANETKPDDYKQQVCLHECIKNRYHNSHCTPKQKRGKTVYDCVTQWGKDFPPKECTAEHWQGQQ